MLRKHGTIISMDGNGRHWENIRIERLCRSVKKEDVYQREYGNGKELYEGLTKYFHFYNFQRPHQELNYNAPAELFHQNNSSITLKMVQSLFKQWRRPQW